MPVFATEMQTRVLAIDPELPDAAAISEAAGLLREGRLVAFPTETVYGLGANALDPEAVRAIFAAKGRPAGNPLIVHVEDPMTAAALAEEWPDVASALADRFWPGPLTLVVRRRDVIPDVVTAGGPTVAIRAPAHPVAGALIAAAGVPIAAPSANRSSHLSPTTAAHVMRGLDGRIDLLLDAGPTPGGIESTVLDVTESTPRILRPGLVTAGAIERVIGPVSVGPRLQGPPRSPGLLERHYAPSTPLEVVEDGQERAHRLLQEGKRVGWLTFDGGPHDEEEGLEIVMMPLDPSQYAAALYAVLHTLDGLGLDRIVVEEPPETDAWAGVRDRLNRASMKDEG